MWVLHILDVLVTIIVDCRARVLLQYCNVFVTRQLSLLVAGPYEIVRKTARQPTTLLDSQQHCQIAGTTSRNLAALPDSWQHCQIAIALQDSWQHCQIDASTAGQLAALPYRSKHCQINGSTARQLVVFSTHLLKEN